MFRLFIVVCVLLVACSKEEIVRELGKGTFKGVVEYTDHLGNRVPRIEELYIVISDLDNKTDTIKVDELGGFKIENLKYGNYNLKFIGNNIQSFVEYGVPHSNNESINKIYITEKPKFEITELFINGVNTIEAKMNITNGASGYTVLFFSRDKDVDFFNYDLYTNGPIFDRHDDRGSEYFNINDINTIYNLERYKNGDTVYVVAYPRPRDIIWKEDLDKKMKFISSLGRPSKTTYFIYNKE